MNLPAMNAHACRYPSSRHHAKLCASGATTTAPLVQSIDSRGFRYRSDHHTIQMTEKIPVTRNEALHPKCSATHGTTSGATIAPTPAPELKVPVASARSCGGNHSAVALIAAGKLQHSPSP